MNITSNHNSPAFSAEISPSYLMPQVMDGLKHWQRKGIGAVMDVARNDGRNDLTLHVSHSLNNPRSGRIGISVSSKDQDNFQFIVKPDEPIKGRQALIEKYEEIKRTCFPESSKP